ncbi:phage tail assembly protein [Acetobacter musti]|uniref:Phage tail assembly protein n=1 Tax=Acetobacter musti TaxID=864732 RepID=A0ABX0JLN9_9PROT|nr:phage tail assembly protein [Acetobacter musti]NHN83668.1 phage tail assembly protein [Acetobacter musti]
MNEPTDAEILRVTGFQEDDGSDERRKDTAKIILKNPVNGYEEITLKEPTVYQTLEAARVVGARPTLETVYSSQIELVAKVSGCSTDCILKLPSRQLDHAVAWVTRFEEESRRDPMRPVDEIALDLSPEYEMTFHPSLKGGGRDFSRMTLREPRVEERLRYKQGEAAGSPEAVLRAEIRLVVDVSEWHQAAVLRMPISKFARAADYLTGFFLAGQATGNLSPLT